MLIVLGAAGLFALCSAVPVPVWPRAALTLLILTLTIFPKVLETHAQSRYVGIAPSALTVYAFTAMAFIGLLASFVRLGSAALRGIGVWIPFVLCGGVAAVAAWPSGAISESGELHLVTGVVCYIVGCALVAGGAVQKRELVASFCAVVGIELLFVVSDVLRHPLYRPTGPQAADLAGRVTGTAQHPDQLAKIMILSVGALLLAEPTAEGWRRMQRYALFLAVLIAALTEGRAAFVGLIIGLLLFFLVQPDRQIRRLHAATILLTGGVTAGSASTIIARFHEDPTGGARPHLSDVAIQAIHQHLLTGVGPNHYVDVVGRSDPLTASGVPVHNAFLLAVAELGLPVALTLGLPFAVLLLRAVRFMRRRGTVGVAARAVVAISPALLLVSYTGWGLLEAPIFELFCLLAGCFAGALLPDLSPALRRAELPAQRNRLKIAHARPEGA